MYTVYTENNIVVRVENHSAIVNIYIYNIFCVGVVMMVGRFKDIKLTTELNKRSEIMLPRPGLSLTHSLSTHIIKGLRCENTLYSGTSDKGHSE